MSEQILDFFSARSKWFPVAIGDHGRNLVISLWSGDRATIIGVTAWRLTPSQKIPSAKIRRKSSRLNFLGSRRHRPHWLSYKRPNCERGVLLVLISAGAIEGHFEGNTPRKGPKGVLFLHDSVPAHRALAVQNKLAYLGFQCLDHPPCSPDHRRRTTTCSLDGKNNWKVAIFRPMRRSLLPRRPGRTDTLLNLFWVACKSFNNGLRSVLSLVWSMLNKSRVWSL